jgi:CRISPR-associated endoribonuclease Cas6
MRIRTSLRFERNVSLPIDHGFLLTSAIYAFLHSSDENYARFLHDEGYAAGEDTNDKRRFKLFCFSGIRSSRRRISVGHLTLTGGEAEWFVCSPLEKFLSEFASGLLLAGVLRVGRETLNIAHVETLAAPRFVTPMKFTCITPIVAGVAAIYNGKSATKYLRPGDEEFSERLRANLLRKYAALHGKAPDDDSFRLTWDENYLKKNRGVKVVDYKGIRIAGAFCPFEISGSCELIELAYNAGLGEKNAGGFGMIEVKK